MAAGPNEILVFINNTTKPWEEDEPAAVFGDRTLAQFKTKVKPSLDYRVEIESLETKLVLARRNRDLADQVSNEECLAVVNGVKSHKDYGENSALYKAMGYVPKDERKSGLVRPSENGQPAAKAA